LKRQHIYININIWKTELTENSNFRLFAANGKTETANFHLFSANGKQRMEVVFLNWQTTN
jgi:hypothetical protein